MNAIQKKAEELLRLIDKEKKKLNPKCTQDAEALQKAAEIFTGYKVNSFGTLIPKKR